LFIFLYLDSLHIFSNWWALIQWNSCTVYWLGYGLDDWSSIPGRRWDFFFLPLCPDRLWGSPTLLGYRGFFPRW
jgi:hypothetical protein